MSFFYLGRLKGNICIIDTDDLVTDTFTDNDIPKLKQLGVKVENITKSNSHLGLSVKNENEYDIYMEGYDLPIYSGSFPRQCKRNDLFGFDIKLAEVGSYHGYLYVAVICNAWCKYDIEFPVVLCQVIGFPFKKVGNGGVMACYTEEPIYFSTKSILKAQYEQTYGDAPDRCLDSKYNSIHISPKGFKVFGVDFSSSNPIYERLDDKLPCYVIKDY